MERCGDILKAGLAASHAEAELVPLLTEGQRRHRAGADSVARRLESLRALRPGLTRGEAATTLAVMADFRVALILADEFGLDGDQLEEWIAATTSRAILRS